MIGSADAQPPAAAARLSVSQGMDEDLIATPVPALVAVLLSKEVESQSQSHLAPGCVLVSATHL